MQYVIKLGAYGLAGVAAFAVAVALMLSVSSTPTPRRRFRRTDGAFVDDRTAPAGAENGDTVYVQHAQH